MQSRLSSEAASNDRLEVHPDPALVAVASALRAAGASFDSIRAALNGELSFAELGLPIVRVGRQLLSMSEGNARRLQRLLVAAGVPFSA